MAPYIGSSKISSGRVFKLTKFCSGPVFFHVVQERNFRVIPSIVSFSLRKHLVPYKLFNIMSHRTAVHSASCTDLVGFDWTHLQTNIPLGFKIQRTDLRGENTLQCNTFTKQETMQWHHLTRNSRIKIHTSCVTI